MSTHGNLDQANNAPSFTVNASTGESGVEQFGNTVFGVSVAEAQVSGKVASPGWVKVTTGTGGRAGRVTYETLVAMKTIVTDAADDSSFPDA